MIRASGTEPLLRVYCQAETKEKVQDILENVSNFLCKLNFSFTFLSLLVYEKVQNRIEMGFSFLLVRLGMDGFGEKFGLARSLN
jgi:hypothetical protein